MACEEALGVGSLGRRFKDNLNEAFKARGLRPPDWGKPLWQQVHRVHERRKDYVHGRVTQERLFAPVNEAEEAISTIRHAIKDVFERIQQMTPLWVDDDCNPELPQGGMAHGTAIAAGVDPSDQTRVRIAYEFRGREYESKVLPPRTDPEPSMHALQQNILPPITAIRAYRGDHELTHEWNVRMGGT